MVCYSFDFPSLFFVFECKHNAAMQKDTTSFSHEKVHQIDTGQYCTDQFYSNTISRRVQS
jgi:hypothetical protein